GSAYTFSYVTLGEFIAWLIGWDLVLEFFVAAAAVAGGWSGYLATALAGTPFAIPTAVANTEEGVINLPAGLLILALTAVLVGGIKLSAWVNRLAVLVKVGVAVLFVLVGLFFVDTANWVPFVPPSEPSEPGTSGLTQPLIQALFGLAPATYGLAGIAS